ncbi:hypothetical protein QN344_02620 [Mucilaginibacter sp. 5B2]|nr:hypothetical protein [Mucilaginibacter sp. 5B2]
MADIGAGQANFCTFKAILLLGVPSAFFSTFAANFLTQRQKLVSYF